MALSKNIKQHGLNVWYPDGSITVEPNPEKDFLENIKRIKQVVDKFPYDA